MQSTAISFSFKSMSGAMCTIYINMNFKRYIKGGLAFNEMWHKYDSKFQYIVSTNYYYLTLLLFLLYLFAKIQ